MTILITFILGYLCIAFEHQLRLNKASTALITGVLCWSFYALSGTAHEVVTEKLLTHMGETHTHTPARACAAGGCRAERR